MLIEQALPIVRLDSDMKELNSSVSCIPLPKESLSIPLQTSLEIPTTFQTESTIPLPPPLPSWVISGGKPSVWWSYKPADLNKQLPPSPPPLPHWVVRNNNQTHLQNVQRPPIPPPLPLNWNFPRPVLIPPVPRPVAPANVDPVPIPPDFTCPVCWEEVAQGTAVKLAGCQHIFCSDCIRDHFKVAIFNGKAKNMSCLSPGCKIVPPDYEIQTILPEDIYIKYQVFKGRAIAAITANSECRWCPRPGCENVILRKDKTQTKLTCDAEGCGTAFCFDCRLEWHQGINCEENRKKNNAEWEDSWKTENNAQNCPNCGVMAQRIDGCDWIKCPLCSHEFCWACLEPHDHNMSAHVHGPRFRHLGDEPYVNNGYNNNNNYNNNYNRNRRRRKIARRVGMVIAAPVVLPVALGVGIAAACVGVVTAPIYLGFKICKKIF